MPAQQREAKKNYIGIVNDWLEEQRSVASPAKSDHVVKDFFLAMMSAVLKRRRETRG